MIPAPKEVLRLLHIINTRKEISKITYFVISLKMNLRNNNVGLEENSATSNRNSNKYF